MSATEGVSSRPTNEPVSATLFTGKSDAYARYRPAYPAEAIDCILAPLADPRRVQAVDIGAGTGIASRQLAERGVRVLGVEPNASMIEMAEKHPGITYKQALAETTTVPDGFADLVTSFQAFHWFKFSKCLREFRRILKPGGRLALVWYHWDRKDPFTARFADLIKTASKQHVHRVSPYHGLPGRVKQLRIKLFWKKGWLPYFKDVQLHRFYYVQDMDLSSLIGCAHSQSNILHDGPAWEWLVAQLRDLAAGELPLRLAHDIEVFTATPR